MGRLNHPESVRIPRRSRLSTRLFERIGRASTSPRSGLDAALRSVYHDMAARVLHETSALLGLFGRPREPGNRRVFDRLGGSEYVPVPKAAEGGRYFEIASAYGVIDRPLRWPASHVWTEPTPARPSSLADDSPGVILSDAVN